MIALILARSVSAQADAIHALTHLSLYALAYRVSRQIVVRRMDAHEAYHYHEQFLKYYAFLVFTGLGWIFFTSIAKLQSSEGVTTSYMLLSVSMGLCANIIALKILNNITKNHGEIAYIHRTHQWLSLDTWGDFAFSVIVLITSLLYMLFPSLPTHIIDPILSLCAVGWIGWSGIQIMKGP